MNNNKIRIEVIKYLGCKVKFEYNGENYEGFVENIILNHKNKHSIILKDCSIKFEEDELDKIKITSR